MPVRNRTARARKLARELGKTMDRRTQNARKVGAAKMKKAAKALEKSAAHYAKLAGEAGVATKKAAKRISKTRTGKALAAAALAIAGYAAIKAARKR